MVKNIYWLDFQTMEVFMNDVFMCLGVPKNDAKICTDILIAADKGGIDSHGISRLKPIYYTRINAGIQKPITKTEIIKEGPTTAVIDGHNGMGQVISHEAMTLAISKAKKYGMGMVAVRNSNHNGIAGYYVNLACDSGMIGITGTNARPTVAPTFGVEPMLGTNPLTIGLPTDEDFPFIIDCATSTIQTGRIEVYARTDTNLKPGWVVGKDGKYRKDTKKILKDLFKGKAALTTLGGSGEKNGGHKGYGYATVVEILSAALQGGAFLKTLLGIDKNGNRVPHRYGHFFIAIDASAFIDLKEFKKTSGTILRDLRNSRKSPGKEKIFTAGEKEYLTWLERKEKGIPLNKNLQKEILSMRDELKLKYKFHFEK